MKTIFARGFILKSQQKEHWFSLKTTTNFQNSPLFERLACFYVIITGNLERFQYFNFETNFLKNDNFFQKTGVLFLVEITKIENAALLYKNQC